MAYYIVHKRNPYFKNGTIIELFEDGFQECVMEESGNRLTCVGNTGLMKPVDPMLPYCIKMLRAGFDDPKLRRKENKFIDPSSDFDADKALAEL